MKTRIYLALFLMAFCSTANAITYVSCTTLQNSGTVLTNSTNQYIIQVQIVATTGGGPLSVTSFTFNTTGTTSTANISNARLWSTGTSGSFATTTLFGSVFAVPNGTFTITGSSSLASGNNNFWLTYDIACNANPGNLVDAECTSLLVGIARTPSATAPSGNHTIVSGPLSGTKTIGTAGDYATLTAAADALNSLGMSGNTTFSILNNLTEAGTVSFNQWLECSGSGFTLTISPAVSVSPTISATVTGAVIEFNGADRVTIDGLNRMTISNLGTGATASTILFFNDATSNTITNCTLLGSTTSTGATAGGTVFFSTGTTSGNDNNTVSNCNIGPAGANLPTKAIMSLGSTSNATIRNSGITINNNNIYDFFNPATTVSGIYIAPGNDSWTISSNRIYQSAPRTFTAAGLGYTGITLNTNIAGDHGVFTVTGNVIGFANSSGTGITTIAGLDNEVRGIDAPSVSTTQATSFQNNRISGITQTSSRAINLINNACFIGISMGEVGGLFNVGNITGNTIGSLDGLSGIIINASSTTAGTSPNVGIWEFGRISGSIVSNNNIGTITINNGGSGTTVGFRGILVSGVAGQNITVNNNTIGGTAVNSIINNIVGEYSMYAIQISAASSGSPTVPNVSMTGNLIRNMTGNANGPVVVMAGIILTGGGGTGVNTISQNTIHSLRNTVTGGSTGAVYAIDLTLPSTANIIERNRIHSISVVSSFTTYQIYGITMRGSGTASFRNNMVRLGFDASGSAITTGFAIIGIMDIAGATANYYYNSVYIGGAGVVSSSHTYAFLSTVVTSTRDFRNNIFYNARSNGSGGAFNVAIRVGGSGVNPAGLTSDYNDILADGTGGNAGVYNGFLYAMLSNWQAITGQDNNSIGINPQFINPTGNASTGDLHLMTTSPLESMGIAIAGITADYDNEVRNAIPDIGADEFTGVVNQVTITATAGTAGPTLYSNMRRAFNAINAGTHQGAISVSINTNTFETSTAGLNSSGTGSASYTSVSIRPAADGLTVQGSSIAPNRGLIELNGADNVTIDGDNPGTSGINRNLTFNTVSSSGNAILWLRSVSVSNGSLNNIIRNSLITGFTPASTSFAVLSSGAGFGATAEIANANNNYTNNLISTVLYGIAVIGPSGNETGTVISNNLIGSAIAANKIGFRGIQIAQQQGISLTGNTIFGVSSTNASSSSPSGGIMVSGSISGGTISRNKIYDIKNTGTTGWASHGICLASSTASSGLFIANNFIWDIAGYGRAGSNVDNGHGIAIIGTGGGYFIYHNTVNMATNQTVNGNTSAIFINTGTGHTIVNNILINNQTDGESRFAINSTVANSAYTLIDYNTYYSSGGTVGYLGSTRNTIANWQAVTLQDANSINVEPLFISASDMHLTVGSNDLLKAGVPIPSITTDIDGKNRNLGRPALGADEIYIPNLWAGNSSTVWNINNNWDNVIVPSGLANIGIPFGVPFLPVLDMSRTINSLSFYRSGATLTLNGHTLTANGTISGNGTITGSSTSNLVLGGTAASLGFTQTSAGTRSINNLTLNSGANISLANSTILNVFGSIELTAASLNLNAQNLVLKSNAANTARIGNLTGSSLSGATNVTVERWIPQRGGTTLGGRAYRFLTSTVSTSTPVSTSIRQNWMENGLVTTTGGVSNPVPGFGTNITGSNGNTNGFDVTQTNQASLYTVTNGLSPNYVAVTNTNNPLNPYTGYFVFVRGDRSTDMSLYNTNVPPSWIPLPTTSTTLRATGTIQQGTITGSSFTNAPVGGAGAWNLITNPYPSALDWNLVFGSCSNIKSSYTIWDPNISQRGAFVTINTSGIASVGLGTRFIQPGQAFFVESLNASVPTISLQENHKAIGNNNEVFLVDPATVESFSVSLYYTENSSYRRVADGVKAIYDASFSASLDGDDATEVTNWDENIAISRGGQRLAIEARPVITKTDTLPLFIGNMKKTNYELEFTGANFSNPLLVARLIDNFTNVETLLSVTGTTVVPITITNDAGSFATNRFTVVFGPAPGTLPITISSVKAYEKNNGIQLEWTMNTEQDMDKYEVEKSADGRSFNKSATVLSKGNSTHLVKYDWFDTNPFTGDNFFRVKSIDKSGVYKYSTIVRVNISKSVVQNINVYPNPVEGNSINLQLENMPKAVYQLILVNSTGQRIYTGTVNHLGGSGTHFIELGIELASGNYVLTVKGNEQTITKKISKK